MNRPQDLFSYIEIAAIVLILLLLGIVKFSRVTEEQVREIQLEARLQQLYEFERTHFENSGRYFNPTAPRFKAYFEWLDEYDCDLRSEEKSFVAVVRADLDEDGEIGVWRIDETSSEIRRLVAD